jgi:hypothetical protein
MWPLFWVLGFASHCGFFSSLGYIKMENKILLILGVGDDRTVEKEALAYAAEQGVRMDVIEVLDSHLYHYGKNDYIVPSYARTQFLYHIQDNLNNDSRWRKQVLKQRAAERGVSLRYAALETDEPIPYIVKVLEKGYSRLFVPRQKRKRLPLRQPGTIFDRLQEVTNVPVTVC